MAGGGLTIFNDGQFRIGLGDSNGDGRLDFDFGLRGQQFGGGPYGWGHQGAEVGLNTARGVYLGGDYSQHSPFGSQAGYGRVFAGGGFETGQVGQDVFGNYGSTYTNAGPHGYYNRNNGGNLYTGNYYGNQTAVNGWGWQQDSVMGNTWTGAQVGQGSWGNVAGQGGGYSYATPGFVPPFGVAHYHSSGCGCAGRFLGFG